MALRSKLRSIRRLLSLATALLLAALLAIPASNIALAQTPPDELTLVNADRDFVERKGGGEFVARPLFDRQIANLFYAVIPFHEPGRIWDKILSALNPARWARAFAGWVIEGVHGTLCGVVERASGEDADNCRRESGR